MTGTIFFRSHLSVSQKTAVSGAYGDGFNYHIEVGVRAHPGRDEAKTKALIASVTSQLDHKALGIDFDLGQEPTSIAVLKWLEARLRQVLGADFVELKLQRGDGLQLEIG